MSRDANRGTPLVGAVVEDGRWKAVGIRTLAGRAARAALAGVGRDPARHEITLLACDDARMARLNGEFRGSPRPTNVLSWPAFPGPVPEQGPEPLFLGDLALGFERCAAEAAEAGVPLADHAAHLVVHGVLHLLGYDHAEQAEADAMEALESNILASMGIANPYSR
jgi:probable rRNA maturation factor